MTRLSLAVCACLLATGFASAQTAVDKAADGKSVVRLDPALDALVAPDAKVELVKGGFGFTEGPVWMQQGKTGFLLFTDIPGAVVWKLTPDGKASVYLDNTGYQGPEVWRWGGTQNNGFERTDPRFEEFSMIGADGLTVDRQGRLILATFAGRSLIRCSDPLLTILAEGGGYGSYKKPVRHKKPVRVVERALMRYTTRVGRADSVGDQKVRHEYRNDPAATTQSGCLSPCNS
jgi:hypothetical protein